VQHLLPQPFYIPIEKNYAQQSFVFHAELARKSDGYWFAWIAALPGCAAWGASKDEALAMLTQTARAYPHMLHDKGVEIPDTIETVNMPIVAVTL
jgi:predicted RNase H-like HicB family nuclease